MAPTPEEIKKRVAELPPEVRAVLYSPDMDRVLQKVGKKFELHLDQLGEVETETVDVMIGFTPTGEFAKNIAEALETDLPKAQNIAEAISTELFSKIRESMKGTPPAPAPMSAPAAVANPPQVTPKALEAHPADLLLTQKTVTVASSITKPTTNNLQPTTGTTNNQQPTTPPTPQPYKVDPYREPTE